MKILDCTLRDGGYYNDWDFGEDLVADYLHAMAAARPDAIEIGFRFRSGGHYRGPFAYSPEAWLRSLPLPEGVPLAVMVNEADFPETGEALAAAVDQVFVRADDSCVELVRVATTIERLDNAASIVSRLNALGYRTALNVMQIARASEEELHRIGRVAADAKPEVLYFADSTGSLRPADIPVIAGGLRNAWSGALGLHAHDNMQLALANCMAAAEAGVEWLDGTVLGMGRGPGNARTENLLLAFANDDHERNDERQDQQSEKRRAAPEDLAPLFQCMADWFEPLRDRYRWGSNPYYFLGGLYGIHPTYIQTMLSDSRYGADDIVATIEYLRARGADRYSKANLEQAGNFYGDAPQGSWQPAELIKGREVLILGSGPGCKTHKDALEQFIQGRKPVVIALNVNSPIRDDLIHLHAACHPIRLLRDSGSYGKVQGALVAPVSALPETVRNSLKETGCYDFGLGLGSGTFEFGASHAILPRPMAAAYAMAIANSGGATRIYMAGFDGYGPEDPRNLEMNDVLSCYQGRPGAVELRAITPTRYEMPEDSVYRLSISPVGADTRNIH